MKPLFPALFLVTALLTACGTSTSGENSPTGSPTPGETGATTITGTVQGWTGGQNSVSLYTAVQVASEATLLSTTTLQQDGSFSLTLPSKTVLTPYLQSLTAPRLLSNVVGCVDTTSLSDAAAQEFTLLGLNLNHGSARTNIIVDSIYNDRTTFSLNTWVYVDRAVTLSGSMKCTVQNGTVTYRFGTLQLTPGWNVLQLDAHETGSTVLDADVALVGMAGRVWTPLDQINAH